MLRCLDALYHLLLKIALLLFSFWRFKISFLFTMKIIMDFGSDKPLSISIIHSVKMSLTGLDTAGGLTGKVTWLFWALVSSLAEKQTNKEIDLSWYLRSFHNRILMTCFWMVCTWVNWTANQRAVAFCVSVNRKLPMSHTGGRVKPREAKFYIHNVIRHNILQLKFLMLTNYY